MSRRSIPKLPTASTFVDNTCMQLGDETLNQYDILLMENLYGRHSFPTCAAGLVGGLGLVPGANSATRAPSLKAVHGSAPDIAGKNIANPTAVLRSALLMLRHLGEHDAAWKITHAIDEVYRYRSKLTRDVGGASGAHRTFADAIIRTSG